MSGKRGSNSRPSAWEAQLNMYNIVIISVIRYYKNQGYNIGTTQAELCNAPTTHFNIRLQLPISPYCT